MVDEFELEDLSLKALTDKITKPCPRCESRNFHSDGKADLPIGIPGGNILAKKMPVAVIVCTNCGFVSFHSLLILGLQPKESPDGD